MVQESPADAQPPEVSPAPAVSAGRRRRRRRLWILAAVLVAVGVSGAYYVDHFLPYWHWRTVEKGAFYRSSQLSPEDLAEAIDAYGLKTIINLRAEHERADGNWYEQQNAVVEAKGARVLDVPLQAGTAPNDAQIARILEVLDDPKNRPALAHCFHGSIRSAALEGLYRREYMGESGPEANDHVETWGHDLSVKYPEIYKFIETYVPRRERTKKP